jgi:hypothetical protein
MFQFERHHDPVAIDHQANYFSHIGAHVTKATFCYALSLQQIKKIIEAFPNLETVIFDDMKLVVDTEEVLHIRNEKIKSMTVSFTVYSCEDMPWTVNGALEPFGRFIRFKDGCLEDFKFIIKSDRKGAVNFNRDLLKKLLENQEQIAQLTPGWSAEKFPLSVAFSYEGKSKRE